MKTLASYVTMCACLLALISAAPVFAQSPSYTNFALAPNSTTPPNLILNGNASIVPQQNPTVLRLNPALTGQAGSAWFNVLQPVAEGFSTTFTFQITNPSTPSADGIAFVIQNSEAGTGALGDGGGYIGYTNITNSLAVEFDTYANPWDPEFPGDQVPPVAANHVAIQSCGTGANTSVHPTCELGEATAPVQLNDGNAHTVQIEYTTNIPIPAGCEFCSSSYMQVTIDGFPVFEGNGVPVDLTQIGLSSVTDGGPQDSAYVGFTGATGASFENNDILSWTFTSHGAQTVTQPAPAGQFTIFNFGSYLYKVKPDQNIDALTVTEVPTDPSTFNAGPNFPGAKCITYDNTGGQCVEFHATCNSANGACSNVNYEVVTSYDVPSGPPITNPGFLKATGKDCVPGVAFDQNIITAFFQTRTDPTTKGSSRPTFSCFVAVQNVTYGPADLDILNLGPLKTKPGATISYVATVTDFGPASGQGVAINNAIPSGTTYVSSSLCSLSGGCSSTACSFDGTTASCLVGNLPKFALEFMITTVKVNANVPSGSKIFDTATVTAFNPDPATKPDRSWTAVTAVSSK